MYLDSSAVHEKYPPELARVFIESKVFLEAGHNCAPLTYEKSWLIQQINVFDPLKWHRSSYEMAKT